jgi:hypothetical protein
MNLGSDSLAGPRKRRSAVFESEKLPMSLLLAYFDPSAGSLLLQALVGGFGGVVVLGRYLWTHFLGNK